MKWTALLSAFVGGALSLVVFNDEADANPGGKNAVNNVNNIDVNIFLAGLARAGNCVAPQNANKPLPQAVAGKQPGGMQGKGGQAMQGQGFPLQQMMAGQGHGKGKGPGKGKGAMHSKGKGKGHGGGMVGGLAFNPMQGPAIMAAPLLNRQGPAQIGGMGMMGQQAKGKQK